MQSECLESLLILFTHSLAIVRRVSMVWKFAKLCFEFKKKRKTHSRLNWFQKNINKNLRGCSFKI